MILSAQTIRRLCRTEGLITPFSERVTLHGMTYGLSSAGYDIRLVENIHIISGGQVQLASSIEKFSMPWNILGRVHDKSSWARQGLFVQNTIIEPGWYGHLTLELTFNGKEECFEIPACSPIAQVIFERLDEPTHQPYQGKYQDQGPGPQEAILRNKPDPT